MVTQSPSPELSRRHRLTIARRRARPQPRVNWRQPDRTVRTPGEVAVPGTGELDGECFFSVGRLASPLSGLYPLRRAASSVPAHASPPAGSCRMPRSFSSLRPAPRWLLGPLVWALVGCYDSTAPRGDTPAFEPAASVRWNALARDFVVKYKTDPPMASRTYALLGVGQDRAVAAAARSSASPRRSITPRP
jgi:hypothetical protein